MNELPATLADLDPRDDVVEKWVEQVQDEPGVGAQVGSQRLQCLPLRVRGDRRSP
jgi:hypothetical protein